MAIADAVDAALCLASTAARRSVQGGVQLVRRIPPAGITAAVVLGLVLVSAGCRGGMGAARALPQPTDFTGWLATGVFVLGGWWLLLKILRG